MPSHVFCTTPAVRDQMRRIRSRDTKPELAVRRLVHGLGYRYRLHRRGLPGTPDLVFHSRRKVIFVHGCFWHQHDCPMGSKQPSTRPEYWRPKLARNVARDHECRRKLAALGWDVLTVWECQLGDGAELAALIKDFLGRRSPSEVPGRTGSRP